MIRFPPCCFMVSFRISMYFSNSCKSWRSRNAKNMSDQHCTTLFVDLWISELDKPYMDGKRTERRTTRRSEHHQKIIHAQPRAATSGCAWPSRAVKRRARGTPFWVGSGGRLIDFPWRSFPWSFVMR